MRNLLLFTSICLLSLVASSDGGHCQRPICSAMRFGDSCGSEWICEKGHLLFEGVDGSFLCVAKGASEDTICRDGKEVSNNDDQILGDEE